MDVSPLYVGMFQATQQRNITGLYSAVEPGEGGRNRMT